MVRGSTFSPPMLRRNWSISPPSPLGARVYIWLLVEHSEVDWRLGLKLGCAPEQAQHLIGLAWSPALRPAGLPFRVGSQTREAAMWGLALDTVAAV